MNRSLSSRKLSGVPTVRRGTVPDWAATHLQALFGTSGVPAGGATQPPPPVGDTAFYPDLSTPDLHAEMVRLSQILQTRGEVIV